VCPFDVPAVGGETANTREVSASSPGVQFPRGLEAFEGTYGVACRLARLGFPVFPCREGGKEPATPHGFKDATTSIDRLAEWWAVSDDGNTRPLNLGLRTGRASGVWVLDLDGPEGLETLACLEQEHGPLPDTVTVGTPSGGRHLYFRLPEGLGVRCATRVFPGVDVRGEGGYVLVPPSRVGDRCYRWVRLGEVALAPDWLLEALHRPSPARTTACSGGVRWREGERNDRLFREGCVLRRRGYSAAEIEAALLALNAERCDPPLPEAEVRKVAGSASRYEPGGGPGGADLPHGATVAPDPNALGRVRSGELARLLGDLEALLRRFVVLSDEQATAVVLWVAHSHALEAAEVTPYLSITSAEKGSGKTRLLECLELVVARPWFSSRTTAAALVRKVDAECPTLLLDESDAAFGGDREYSETLRGVLNAGYRRGGRVTVCVGQGANLEVRDFEVFCPKAIAGIGQLPDTVASRSVPIRLKRRRPDEVVERFRRRDAEPLFGPLRERLAALLAAPEVVAVLRGARPEVPEGLRDRTAEVWEPVLAIADLAGGVWPERAREAALALREQSEDESASLGTRLLADIRRVFEASGIDRFATRAPSRSSARPATTGSSARPARSEPARATTRHRTSSRAERQPCSSSPGLRPLPRWRKKRWKSRAMVSPEGIRRGPASSSSSSAADSRRSTKARASGSCWTAAVTRRSYSSAACSSSEASTTTFAARSNALTSANATLVFGVAAT